MEFPWPHLQQQGALDRIRPLTIGAAYWRSFDFLAPIDWGAQVVLAQVFKALPMDDGGWDPAHVNLENCGADRFARHWRITRTA